jgi:DNA-binding NarL/FixJ family response regulator
MSGIDCLQRMKSTIHATTKFVMMTGFRDPETLDQAKEVGAELVLLKPFKMSEFVTCAESG